MNPSRKVNLPKLRFPEFQDAPQWNQRPLSYVFNVIKNGKANAQDHQDDGIYPLFDRSDLIKQSETFLFDAEAVILPGEGMKFQPRYYNGKFNLHQRVYALMDPVAHAIFAFYSLDRFKALLADSAVKSTVLSLRLPIIEKFSIPVPNSFKEQQKIADCLTSLDDLIGAQEQKINLLKLHKRGLLQQLFPRSSGTIQKLRSPEFSNLSDHLYPDRLEFRQLQEIFDIKNGYTPSKKNPDYWTDGSIPWFRMEDIRKNGRVLNDSIQHVTPEAVKRGVLFPANSIIMATTATIGEHALITVDSLANQRFTFLSKKVNRSIDLDMKFMFYYGYILGDWCKKNTNAGGFESVDMKMFKKLCIPIPPLEVQLKIADCLTLLDNLIYAQEEKINLLKLHKRGLMQQLFPNPILNDES